MDKTIIFNVEKKDYVKLIEEIISFCKTDFERKMYNEKDEKSRSTYACGDNAYQHVSCI